LLYFLLSFPFTQNAPDGYGFPSGVSEVHTQELAAKISENERLHMKLLEVTQKSERKISGMESKIVKLEQEVSTHLAAVDEINREHELQAESIRTEKAMLEAKLASQSSELDTLRKAMEKYVLCYTCMRMDQFDFINMHVRCACTTMSVEMLKLNKEQRKRWLH